MTCEDVVAKALERKLVGAELALVAEFCRFHRGDGMLAYASLWAHIDFVALRGELIPNLLLASEFQQNVDRILALRRKGLAAGEIAREVRSKRRGGQKALVASPTGQPFLDAIKAYDAHSSSVASQWRVWHAKLRAELDSALSALVPPASQRERSWAARELGLGVNARKVGDALLGSRKSGGAVPNLGAVPGA